MKTKSYASKQVGNIEIKTEANYLTINSQRLTLRSLNQDAKEELLINYTALLIKPENVRLFGDGNPWSPELIDELVTGESIKWNEGKPFGALSVHNAQTNEFMGYLDLHQVIEEYAKVGAGHSNAVEIGYILDNAFWGQGYGTEIAIIAKKYIKHVIAESSETKQLENRPKEIVATVHPKNEGSFKILQKTLKHKEEEELIKWGQPRLLFFKPLKSHLAPSPNTMQLEYSNLLV